VSISLDAMSAQHVNIGMSISLLALHRLAELVDVQRQTAIVILAPAITAVLLRPQR